MFTYRMYQLSNMHMRDFQTFISMYKFQFHQYLLPRQAENGSKLNVLATFLLSMIQVTKHNLKLIELESSPNFYLSRKIHQPLGFTLGIQICVGTLSWSESLIIVLQLYCIVSILTNTVNKYSITVSNIIIRKIS